VENICEKVSFLVKVVKKNQIFGLVQNIRKCYSETEMLFILALDGHHNTYQIVYPQSLHLVADTG